MTLKLAVSRRRPPVPYGANFLLLASPSGNAEEQHVPMTSGLSRLRTRKCSSVFSSRVSGACWSTRSIACFRFLSTCTKCQKLSLSGYDVSFSRFWTPLPTSNRNWIRLPTGHAIATLLIDWKNVKVTDQESVKTDRTDDCQMPVTDAICIRKSKNMNRDDRSYQLSHVQDKLLTDIRNRKSVLMKTSDRRSKRL